MTAERLEVLQAVGAESLLLAAVDVASGVVADVAGDETQGVGQCGADDEGVVLGGLKRRDPACGGEVEGQDAVGEPGQDALFSSPSPVSPGDAAETVP